MGFISFLLNVGKVAVGGVVFLAAALALPALMIEGQTTIAAVLAIIGVVGLLYAIYQRNQLATVQ